MLEEVNRTWLEVLGGTLVLSLYPESNVKPHTWLSHPSITTAMFREAELRFVQ